MTDIDTIIAGDCLAVLPTLPAGCADLVFADPPFNIGYQYDQYDDRRERTDYLAWADRWLAEAVRVLTPHGSLCVTMCAELSCYYQVRLYEMGLTFRNTIIWHETFSTHQNHKFGRDHRPILYFTRHRKRFTFNPDAIRVRSRRQEMGDKRANPLGRVPGDVWQFPRLPGNAKERTGHPCQMPETVLDRIIRATTNPGDLVLDPFAGSGTTLAVAKKLGRNFVGVELSEQYADAARARCAGGPGRTSQR
jgi:DNA modification methylase